MKNLRPCSLESTLTSSCVFFFWPTLTKPKRYSVDNNMTQRKAEIFTSVAAGNKHLAFLQKKKNECSVKIIPIYILSTNRLSIVTAVISIAPLQTQINNKKDKRTLTDWELSHAEHWMIQRSLQDIISEHRSHWHLDTGELLETNTKDRMKMKHLLPWQQTPRRLSPGCRPTCDPPSENFSSADSHSAIRPTDSTRSAAVLFCFCEKLQRNIEVIVLY